MADDRGLDGSGTAYGCADPDDRAAAGTVHPHAGLEPPSHGKDVQATIDYSSASPLGSSDRVKVSARTRPQGWPSLQVRVRPGQPRGRGDGQTCTVRDHTLELRTATPTCPDAKDPW